MTLIQSADLENPAAEMRRFVDSYRKRFRAEPNFPALHAYDATRMLFAALEKTTRRQKIRQALLNMNHFESLQSDLAFDRYGDQKTPRLHLACISNGKFVKVD